jgi:hypothetical protein
MKLMPNKIPEIKVTLEFNCGGVLHKTENFVPLRVGRGGVRWCLDTYDGIGFWVRTEYTKAVNLFEEYYKDYPEEEPRRVCSCGYDEDDIDDHTSVWGGAGPDCEIGQREAAL